MGTSLVLVAVAEVDEAIHAGVETVAIEPQREGEAEPAADASVRGRRFEARLEVAFKGVLDADAVRVDFEVGASEAASARVMPATCSASPCPAPSRGR